MLESQSLSSIIPLVAIERPACPKCHVWTAPSWQELFSRFAALVGAAMCSAF
jgi:hypothetical protein